MSVTISSGDREGLNVSNTNFVRLMELIGVDLDTNQGLCGEFPHAELPKLGQKIEFVLRSLQAMPELDGGTPNIHHPVRPGGPLIIECGLREGYYADRLLVLAKEVLAAYKAGHALCFG